jgi:formamidopyrimidine-DNA glycosylase
MPELPEVQTVVDTLRPRLLGRRISAVCLHRLDILLPAGVDLPGELNGKSIASIDRRGKRIIFSLDNWCRFYIHLGMTGRLTVAPSASIPLNLPAPPHTHLQWQIGSDTVFFRDPRRFGGIWWLGRDTPPDAGMGPEPLTQRPGQLASRLSRTTRAIKVALLDQSLVAGLGNIYVDESLFQAGIHPLTPANKLTMEQFGALNRAIKSTLRRALRHRGSTLRDYRDADGQAGYFQSMHRVYDREGKPCRKCRTKIERIVLGGRSTHFCPECQETRGASRCRGRDH